MVNWFSLHYVHINPYFSNKFLIRTKLQSWHSFMDLFLLFFVFFHGNSDYKKEKERQKMTTFKGIFADNVVKKQKKS